MLVNSHDSTALAPDARECRCGCRYPRSLSGRGGIGTWRCVALKILFVLWLVHDVHGQYSVTTNRTGLTIARYSGSDSVVAVPRIIGNRPVTEIGGAAFVGRANLKSILLPDSITSIQDGAFANCSSLIDVVMSSNVTTIAESAFYFCAITNLVVPSGVTSVGDFAFSFCTNLTDVHIAAATANIGDRAFFACDNIGRIRVDALNKDYSSIDGVLFDKKRESLILCPSLKSGGYCVPVGVKKIGPYAFHGCKRLREVTLPSSVTRIEDCAFADCAGLTNVEVGSSMVTIGVESFEACSSLSKLVLPASIADIKDGAFKWCPNLAEVHFSGNMPSIGHDIFEGSSNVVVYYQSGREGWGASFAGRPAKPMAAGSYLDIRQMK